MLFSKFSLAFLGCHPQPIVLFYAVGMCYKCNNRKIEGTRQEKGKRLGKVVSNFRVIPVLMAYS